MNHFTYDIETNSWSFTYLSNDQIMDLSKLDHQLYMSQRFHWECGQGDIYELLLDMAKSKAMQHAMET